MKLRGTYSLQFIINTNLGKKKRAYLCHVEDKIGNGGQCSTSYMNISIYLELLKTNFNLGKFQIHTTSSQNNKEEVNNKENLFNIFSHTQTDNMGLAVRKTDNMRPSNTRILYRHTHTHTNR